MAFLRMKTTVTGMDASDDRLWLNLLAEDEELMRTGKISKKKQWCDLCDDLKAHVLSFVEQDHPAYAPARRVCKAWSQMLPKIKVLWMCEDLMNMDCSEVVGKRLLQVVLDPAGGWMTNPSIMKSITIPRMIDTKGAPIPLHWSQSDPRLYS